MTVQIWHCFGRPELTSHLVFIAYMPTLRVVLYCSRGTLRTDVVVLHGPVQGLDSSSSPSRLSPPTCCSRFRFLPGVANSLTPLHGQFSKSPSLKKSTLRCINTTSIQAIWYEYHPSTPSGSRTAGPDEGIFIPTRLTSIQQSKCGDVYTTRCMSMTQLGQKTSRATVQV